VNFSRSKLRQLEAKSRAQPCLECGLKPDGPGYIVYDHRPEGSEEYCPSCGRPLWFIIEVVRDGSGDEEDEGGGALRWP
jgi:hypothetical protein